MKKLVALIILVGLLAVTVGCAGGTTSQATSSGGAVTSKTEKTAS